MGTNFRNTVLTLPQFVPTPDLLSLPSDYSVLSLEKIITNHVTKIQNTVPELQIRREILGIFFLISLP